MYKQMLPQREVGRYIPVTRTDEKIIQLLFTAEKPTKLQTASEP